MAGQQRGPRAASTRGDFTGNQKAKLAAEHEAAVEARREELGIVTERQNAIKDEGVINVMDPDRPTLEIDGLDEDEAEQLEVVTTETGALDVQRRPEPAPEQGTRIGGDAKIDVFELPEERTTARTPEALSKDNQNAKTLIKVLYDLEDVTIGYGNTFNFKQDHRYHVPRWVAAHLEEKGLAVVLSLNPV